MSGHHQRRLAGGAGSLTTLTRSSRVTSSSSTDITGLVNSGDLIISNVSRKNNSVSTPAGFTVIVEKTSGFNTKLCYKISDGTETSGGNDGGSGGQVSTLILRGDVPITGVAVLASDLKGGSSPAQASASTSGYTLPIVGLGFTGNEDNESPEGLSFSPTADESWVTSSFSNKHTIDFKFYAEGDTPAANVTQEKDDGAGEDMHAAVVLELSY